MEVKQLDEVAETGAEVLKIRATDGMMAFTSEVAALKAELAYQEGRHEDAFRLIRIAELFALRQFQEKDATATWLASVRLTGEF